MLGIADNGLCTQSGWQVQGCQAAKRMSHKRLGPIFLRVTMAKVSLLQREMNSLRIPFVLSGQCPALYSSRGHSITEDSAPWPILAVIPSASTELSKPTEWSSVIDRKSLYMQYI